ncbi:glycoside hydrolase family 26 [Stackebrandtia nassauensis DSM 44728]|uniref:Glycoside hydrolase family 26 n=1 Tax=Stackebrandtia nassauensis (strain DSM 44728 / CIP 108903 / NRRL B-16338 / NBRC 102104 / LLR-40K-21) TaxID=446470 RepID=D3PWH1_STANL|nr:glycoside hydrolase family 26 [Stackebrandtia nassauensis DSM 44728]
MRDSADNRVLIGQEISSWSADTYDTFVHGLERKTGKRPAVVGLSLLEPGDYDTGGVDCLIDHHQRGGLVTVSTHWTHPWGDHPDTDKYRVIDDHAPKPDLRELLSGAPDSAPKRKYWEQVDDLTRVLTRLDKEGALVLLRPFHEMNGLWFWWGHDETTDHTALIDLWRDLHAHLSAKLSNLLWVYSPAASWNAGIAKYYPGADYVDLAGIDVYADDLRPYDPQHRPEDDDWTELSRLGHPAGLAEFGPAADSFPDGAATLTTRLADTYTKAVFAHAWTSWAEGQQRALVEQPDIDKALDDPAILTLDEVDWQK